MTQPAYRATHRAGSEQGSDQPNRARTLAGTLGLTTLGTVLPGSGILLAGRRTLGLVLVAASLGLVGLGRYARTHESQMLAAAVDPDKLLAAAVVSLLLLVGLVAVVIGTYRMVRRLHAPTGQRAVEAVFVTVLCLLVATPFALATRYAVLQRDLLGTIFTDDGPGAAPLFGDDDRVNVLMLGGDGGVHRIGIRTDTVILASIDTETGDTALFSLPRNLQNVPFPPGSPLADLYPGGFTGEGDPLEWMLNAVYGNVPAQHPDALEDVDNQGAEAVKQAVSGALSLDVDYYVLVNLRGFREVVDAIDGVTVNINKPIPIGGNTDRGIPPDDYLQPGPRQHLDGFQALWFARGRYGLVDYDRMERQRCVIGALIDEVDPITLLRHYEDLADAGKRIVRTDMPPDVLSSLAEVAPRLQDGDVRSVVFRSSDRFDPNEPDYAWMRRQVQKALTARSEGSVTPGAATPSPGTEPTAEPAGSPRHRHLAAARRAVADPCAYHPVG